VGGPSFVSGLTLDIPVASHAESYARIVAGTAFRRRLIQAASNVAALAYDEQVGAALRVEVVDGVLALEVLEIRTVDNRRHG